MPIPDFMIKQTNSKIVIKQSTKYMRLKQIQLPGGHKEGRASFPTKIQYKVFTIPWLKSYLEERKEEEHAGRREEGGAWLFLLFCPTPKCQG